MPKRFDPECDKISDLVATVAPPTDEQLKVGLAAIDDYYEGTKDAPFEGSVAYVYRAMKALEN